MKGRKPPRRGMAVLFVAFIIFAALLGALLLDKYNERNLRPAPATGGTTGTMRLVTLFFANPAGDSLVREGREIESCSDSASCVAALVEELAAGPLGDLGPTLPPATTVRSVTVTGDTAVIDLGSELVDGLPEGSSAEITAVYSIVDSVAVNFPQIRRVAFLIEGNRTATLKGHLDLREPLPPDFALEKSEPAAAR